MPSGRGERLLNYLASLRRVEPSRKRDRIHSFPGLSHIHPDYAAHPPTVDMERLKRARAAAVMEKGRGVYLSKCAICHGNDGMGDKVTYPPLAGSEWLKEKPDAEIVKIILQGLTGPITVNGKEWNSTMLPPGVTNSRDLANLLTFLRRQFGGVEKAPTRGTDGRHPPGAVTAHVITVAGRSPRGMFFLHGFKQCRRAVAEKIPRFTLLEYAAETEANAIP